MHIRSEHDVVSIGTGKRIAGTTRTLANNQCGNVSKVTLPAISAIQAGMRAICAHRMTTVLTLVEAQPEYHEDIKWG